MLYDTERECWIAVGHASVMEGLRNEEWFNNEYSSNFDPFLAGSTGEVHSHFRRLVQQSADWFDRPSIEGFATQWMSNFCQQALLEGGFDAVTDLGIPLPRAFTVDMLGLEPDEVKLLTDALSPQRVEINQALQSVGCAIASIMQVRRKAPKARRGILDKLMDKDAYNYLSDEQIISLTRHLWFAGTVTLSGLLPACAVRLAHDRAITSRLRENLSLIPSFVSEILRLESITQFVPRKCIREIHFAGHQLNHGDLILLHLGAANRDSTVFHSPDSLLLERPPYKHLALGLGSHVCLGSIIARTIAETCVQELLLGTNQIKPAQNGMTVKFEKCIGFRALMPIQLNVTA
jgi:cytochrome P450